MLGNVNCSFRTRTKFNFKVPNADVTLFFVKKTAWPYSLRDLLPGEVSVSKQLFEGW